MNIILLWAFSVELSIDSCSIFIAKGMTLKEVKVAYALKVAFIFEVEQVQ